MKFGKWVIRCAICGEEEEAGGTFEDATEVFLDSCWTWNKLTKGEKTESYCFRCIDKKEFMDEEVQRMLQNLNLGGDV